MRKKLNLFDGIPSWTERPFETVILATASLKNICLPKSSAPEHIPLKQLSSLAQPEILWATRELRAVVASVKLKQVAVEKLPIGARQATEVMGPS